MADVLKERDELKAELELARPLLDWAKGADASLIYHLTTAVRTGKCKDCDKAKMSISILTDILADIEDRAYRERKGERRKK
jgi:hypothetical protein